MIAPECFSSDWVERCRADFGAGSSLLVEKTIHALALLDALARRDVPFVFRGGTSLLLRLPRLRRLSIDIDITSPLPDGELDLVLAEVGTMPPFERFEEDQRGHHRLPARRHFKFHYTPLRNWGNQTSHVILDVVRDSAVHPRIDRVPLQSPLIRVIEAAAVSVPSIEGLLADKLTAFAPRTVGVPLRPGSAMQVVKHLFDAAELLEAMTHPGELAAAYGVLFAAENRYRDGRFSRDEALEDIADTGRLICGLGLKGAPPSAEAEMLQDGARALAGHLLGTRFGQPELKLAAAKLVWVAETLRRGDIPAGGLPRFDATRIGALIDARLPGDEHLYRLKRLLPEVYYYLALGAGVIAP